MKTPFSKAWSFWRQEVVTIIVGTLWKNTWNLKIEPWILKNTIVIIMCSFSLYSQVRFTLRTLPRSSLFENFRVGTSEESWEKHVSCWCQLVFQLDVFRPESSNEHNYVPLLSSEQKSSNEAWLSKRGTFRGIIPNEAYVMRCIFGCHFVQAIWLSVLACTLFAPQLSPTTPLR